MIDKFIKVGKVVSITGVRRSGKSTIMKQYVANLLKQGIKSQNILFVNLEESEFGKPTLELLLKI